MASAALSRLMDKKPPKKRMPPAFTDGPPEDDARGSGTEGGELETDAPEGMDREPMGEGGDEPEPAGEGGGFKEHVEMAIDDLADIAGISPEDRQDFGTALQAVIHAAVADAMHGGEETEEMDAGDEVEPDAEEPDPEE